MAAVGETGREGRTMDKATEQRRKVATAKFMLRVIAAERAQGITRPDVEQFTARMQAQAKGTMTTCAACV